MSVPFNIQTLRQRKLYLLSGMSDSGCAWLSCEERDALVEAVQAAAWVSAEMRDRFELGPNDSKSLAFLDAALACFCGFGDDDGSAADGGAGGDRA